MAASAFDGLGIGARSSLTKSPEAMKDLGDSRGQQQNRARVFQRLEDLFFFNSGRIQI